jgi:O-methyltransferase involved in polyketide biosynthesis
MNNLINVSELQEVSETLLITVYLRSLETKREDGFIKDDKSVEIVNSINYNFAKFDSESKQTIIAIRTAIIDEVVKNFISQNSNAIIVSLGTGLSTRFFRVDNNLIHWFGIDLPRVKSVWNTLIGESERFQYLSYSILDFDWIEKIKEATSGKILFIAEGLLMYLSELEVKQLIITLKNNFPDSEIVFDSLGLFSAKNTQINPVVSKTNASFKWGINNLKEIETWDRGIKLIAQWYYFDKYKQRLGWLELLKYIFILKSRSKIGHFRFV